MSGKTPIRLVHGLARSGVTVFCKCLGVMEGVALLSEINPKGRAFIDPVFQARRWLALITDEEAAALARDDDFARVIGLLEERARASGQTLVVRDWNHLDFVGRPFLAEPDMRMALVEALQDRFEILACAVVRHPRDQINSLYRTTEWKDAEPPRVSAVLAGTRRFAEACGAAATIRYEDFGRDPDGQLRVACAVLGIAFDPGYAEHWQTFDAITGDVGGSRGGTARIRAVESAPFAPDMFPDDMEQRLQDNEDYREVCKTWGYEP